MSFYWEFLWPVQVRTNVVIQLPSFSWVYLHSEMFAYTSTSRNSSLMMMLKGIIVTDDARPVGAQVY